MPWASVILLIRHAEKPGPDWGAGTDERGAPDPHGLASRGWQRAGAWTELFAPSLLAAGGLPRPGHIVASAARPGMPGGPEGSESHRPAQTMQPLARKLGLGVDETWTKGEEEQLAAALPGLSGIVLVCWQHERIPEIARRIATSGAIPATWPEARYNPVFRFTREHEDSPWRFDQVVPVMLDGDSSDPL